MKLLIFKGKETKHLLDAHKSAVIFDIAPILAG